MKRSATVSCSSEAVSSDEEDCQPGAPARPGRKADTLAPVPPERQSAALSIPAGGAKGAFLTTDTAAKRTRLTPAFASTFAHASPAEVIVRLPSGSGDSSPVDAAAVLNSRRGLASEDTRLVNFSKLFALEGQPTSSAGVSSKLKAAIRLGIPNDMRGALWPILCDAIVSAAENPELYAQALVRTFGAGSGESVLHPATFGAPLNSVADGLFLSESGRKAQLRLCTVFAIENPDVYYSPALVKLAGVLLHVMDEPMCFEVMFSMVERSRGGNFYLTLTQHEAALFVETFVDLVGKELSKIHKHLVRKLKLDLVLVCAAWFDSLFFGHLPFWTAMHVLDAFLYEGYKILYRVGLAAIKSVQSELLQCAGAGAAQTVLQEALLGQTKSSVLMAAAFKLSLSRKTFAALKAENAKTLHLADMSRYPRAVAYNRPVLDRASSLASYEELCCVWSWMPTRHRLKAGLYAFSAAELGYSLSTLINESRFSPALRREPDGPFLLLLQAKTASTMHVVGVFFSHALVPEKPSVHTSHAFTGTGETFVFSLRPEMHVYRWHPGSNSLFYAYARHTLFVGDGASGNALKIDEALRTIISLPCDTFASPVLVPSDATCLDVELYAVRDTGNEPELQKTSSYVRSRTASRTASTGAATGVAVSRTGSLV